MGLFEIAKRTQWDEGQEWKYKMPPPETLRPKIADNSTRSFPQMGDVSCRSALSDLMVNIDFYELSPADLKMHLVCRVADQLQPITQKHGIEGLVMGVE